MNRTVARIRTFYISILESNVNISPLLFVLVSSLFAEESNSVSDVMKSYEIYDAKGRLLKTFPTTETAKQGLAQFYAQNPNDLYYIANPLKKRNAAESPQELEPVLTWKKSRYLEADRSKPYRVCPIVKGKGFWTSRFDLAEDSSGCALVTTQYRTYGDLLVFHDIRDSVPLDSAWLLVNQKLIDLSKSEHYLLKRQTLDEVLIVDKMETTIHDVLYFEKQSKKEDGYGFFCPAFMMSIRNYPNGDYLGNPDMPYTYASLFEDFMRYRSLSEGLNPLFNETDTLCDLTRNGYRVPTVLEWVALRRAGHKNYYWGEADDSITVSKFEWFHPKQMHKVGQLQPNPYGLYDAMGNVMEQVLPYPEKCWVAEDECNFDIGEKECDLFKNSLLPRFVLGETRSGVMNESHEMKWDAPVPMTAPRIIRGFRLVRQIWLR